MNDAVNPTLDRTQAAVDHTPLSAKAPASLSLSMSAYFYLFDEHNIFVVLLFQYFTNLQSQFPLHL